MWENLKNLSDLAKFLLMLLVYTGSMMWWASSVSVKVDANADYRKEDIKVVATLAQQTLVNTKFIDTIQKQVASMSALEQESIRMHAKCSALMDVMLKRLDRVEQDERNIQKEHR